MSNRYTYTISEDLVVEMFDTENPNDNGAPFLRQSHQPNGNATPFADRAEAEDFANKIIDNLLNPPAVEDIVEEELPQEVTPQA